MVNSRLVRVSPEFNKWIDDKRMLTKLSTSAITRVLAGKLNGMEFTEIRRKRKPKRLSLKRVMKSEVRDFFDEIL